MNDPAIPADGDLHRLRNRVFGRLVVPAVPSAFVVAYLICLMMGLSGATLVRAVVFILTPCLLVALVIGFMSLKWLFDRAVASGPNDAPGGRLKRILELPRRIETFVYVGTWILGAVSFSSITCLTYDRNRLLVAAGAVAGLFASLFLGPVITMQVEDDLRPLALDEFRRGPKVKLEGRGLFWLRQRWYLPYTFGIALVSMAVFSSIVIVTKYHEASERLLQGLEVQGIGAAGAVVRRELDRLLVDVGVPVITIVGLLLGAFGIIGWMLARRQARAAEAVERSLRAMAAGSPELPEWVASDEIGDLAVGVGAVATEMQHVFEQLRAMATGDLGKELEGDSGLLKAFRESQTAMRRLAQLMVSLSRGEVAAEANVPGDLGRNFEQLLKAFRAIVERAQSIAEGDLSRDVDIPGALGDAIQRMTGNLRQMVGQTQSVSGNIGDIVVSLQSAATQLSTGTTEQVAAITETANTMAEMSQTSAVSADRATELIKQGDAAATVVEEGGQTAEATTEAMTAIAASLQKVASASDALSEHVKRIDKITETVGFLADQSSTLAINAAIEAARAGEAGKGFGVVAREIRALASDSRKAAAQIRDLLVEIRERMGQVDGSVAAGAGTVEEGNRLAQRLSEVISQLGVTIHEAVGLMRQVEGSARQHQAGVGQVSQALTNMQKASESIRDGARLLGELSGKARSLSTNLQTTSGAYVLPPTAA
jgi:methyl-accepting chemotaxis protein